MREKLACSEASIHPPGRLDFGNPPEHTPPKARYYAESSRIYLHRLRCRPGIALGSFHALPGDKFRWAMSSHVHAAEATSRDGIKMAAKFGFHGIEPWGNELQEYLNRPPAEFKKILDESGISISSVASGGEYFDTTRVKDTIADNEANAKWASISV